MTLKSQLGCLWFILVLVLPAWCVYAQPVVINEFMAANGGAVLSEDGLSPDWIELHNTSDQTVSLAGLYLSDKLDDLTKWRFPDDLPDLTTLAPDGYRIVWASGSDSTPTELHADFSLNADGEAVVLTDLDGQTILDSIEFGSQSPDTSFGRDPNALATQGDTPQWAMLQAPTPGQANASGFLGQVEPVHFSVERGFYNEPFMLTLTTETPDAEIWFCRGGEIPLSSFYENRAGERIWIGEQYTEPIAVGKTVCIRALARKPGWKTSALVTHTYIFPEDVIRQSTRPGGFPTSWGRRTVDYAMDYRIVNDPVYNSTIQDDLRSTPSVCIVIPNDDFFGEDGIYANPTRKGDDWEREASVEWIDPNTGEQFGVNAGLRIQGGAYARARSSNPKSGLQLFFRGRYGLAKLDYPLFPDTDVQSFNRLALREIWNYSWIGDSGSYGADYLRDTFCRDTIRDMGRLTPYGRPVQIYINGLYWGLYIMTERIDDDFAADHLGGDKADYDVLEAPSSQGGSTHMKVAGGNETTAQEAWATLFALADNDLSDPNAYEAMQQYVDLPAMIDYMLMIYYSGSRDAPVFLGDQYTPRNFYALRSREPGSPFLFVPWDVEWCLENPYENRVFLVGVWQPHYLMDRLAANADFRMLLADQIYKAFFNDGPLTREQATQRYLSRAHQIAGAIVGESARWGDVLRNPPPTQATWQAEVDRLVNQYFSGRTETVLEQLKDRGWYPAVEAPVYLINASKQHGGLAQAGDLLSIDNPNGSGTVFYTLDGSDPRLLVDPEENDIRLVDEKQNKRILVPTQEIGSQWVEAAFNDTQWTLGSGNVGFELGSGYQNMINADVQNNMWGRSASCYIRIPFEVTNPSGLSRLKLRIRYDDGFAAYINGVPVAQANASLPLSWDAHADYAHEAGPAFREFQITHLESLHLNPRANVLAIHGLNAAANSTDFLISAELLGVEGVSYDDLLYTGPIDLDKSIRIKSRILQDAQWSPLHEAVYKVGPVAQNLRISEIMYHPADPNLEFVELINIGQDPINLNLVEFTRGLVQVVCPDRTDDPVQRNGKIGQLLRIRFDPHQLFTSTSNIHRRNV